MKPTLECLEDRLCPALTPAQVRHAYWADVTPYDGSGTTVAIISVGHNPTIAGDLRVFDATYGLPDPPSFVQVGEDGGPPPAYSDPVWNMESALDVEWAHVMAPRASIVLVEVQSITLDAIDTARNWPGVVSVSMSWGTSDGGNNGPLDAHFTTPAGHPGVTFFAASGDFGGATFANTFWPSDSPNVVSVGGTSLYLNSDSTIGAEGAWPGGGGGVNAFGPRPRYQDGVVPSPQRGTPDVAFDADPNTGVAVYCTSHIPGSGPWYVIGGTSVGAPAWAGVNAVIEQARMAHGLPAMDGATGFLPALYKLGGYGLLDTNWGSNGFSAHPGWDFATGFGTPLVARLVTALATPGFVSPDFKYVNQVFLDLLGRPIPDADVAGWVNYLHSAGPSGFTATIVGTHEYHARYVTGLYRTILGREPDPAGLDHWSSLLDSGATTPAQEVGYFYASPEYLATHGADPVSYINALYRGLLGRGATPSDVNGWMGYLKTYGYWQTAEAIYASPESVNDRIGAAYAAYFRRPPDPLAYSVWPPSMGGGDFGLISGIEASPEFYNLAQTL